MRIKLLAISLLCLFGITSSDAAYAQSVGVSGRSGLYEHAFLNKKANQDVFNPDSDQDLKDELDSSEPANQQRNYGEGVSDGSQGGMSPTSASMSPTGGGQTDNQTQQRPTQQHSAEMQKQWWTHEQGCSACKRDNATGPQGPHWKEEPKQQRTVQDSTMAAKHMAERLDKKEHTGGPITTEEMMAGMGELAAQIPAQASSTESNFKAGQQQQQGAAQGIADSMADAFDPTWFAMLELQSEGLINVANEAAGSPCSSLQPVKSHQNAVWMVMQMYKGCYIPFALLLLLPGAVMTQTKGLVANGILSNQNDEDGVSPFTGILRSLIAIFLIPACQVIVSYSIDIGNSLQYEVEKHINPAIIYLWADEQVFRAPTENKVHKILPPTMFPVLGKLSEGPEAMSGVEGQSKATVMLQTLANSTAQSAAFGLVMLSAFQITIACYLLLMGPMAAAFYAWPTGIASLFTRVFTTWVDAVINVSLWKFWWVVVLLCIDTRLGWLGMADVYTEWELLMFIAFLVILTYVPFNPFDFKAGDMVGQVMSKAEQAVGKASEEGGK